MDFKPPTLPDFEVEPFDYEDTIFKDMAEDIKKSQKSTEDKIDALIEEERKSSKFNKRIAISTLIIAVLTLVATIIGTIFSIFIT